MDLREVNYQLKKWAHRNNGKPATHGANAEFLDLVSKQTKMTKEKLAHDNAKKFHDDVYAETKDYLSTKARSYRESYKEDWGRER